MGWRRDPWDPPRGGRIRSVALWTVGIVAALVVLGVFVEVVQPAAFRFAGGAVDDLGGSQRAANVVVGGIYLAAVATMAGWAALLRSRGLAPVVLVAAAVALPLWLLAIGLTPPAREPDESARLVTGWLGDRTLGARLDDATFFGVGLVLAAVAVWWVVQRLRRGGRPSLRPTGSGIR